MVASIMRLYNAYGLIINSEIDFGEKTISNGKPDVFIQERKINDNSFHEIVSENDFWIGNNTTRNEIMIKWDNIGKFSVQNGRNIYFESFTDDKDLLKLYLLGPVMAILLHQRSFLVIHASSIETDSGVVAFSGPSGAGKSTIAAIFNNMGYKVVSDDILAIKVDSNGFSSVYPGFPKLKLSSILSGFKWENGDQEVKKIGPEGYLINFNYDFSDFLPLKKIYVLSKAPHPSIGKLNLQKGLMELIYNSYPYLIFQENDKMKNLNQCVDLLKKTEVSALNYPHSLTYKSELIDLIEDDIL